MAFLAHHPDVRCQTSFAIASPSFQVVTVPSSPMLSLPFTHSPPPPLPLNIINPPSPPPNIRFYYAVDIFLHGQPYPFCSHASQPIQTFEFLNTRHPSVIGRGFEFGLYRPRHESKGMRNI
ncbi:hypothetical protein QL285_083855 [Trifolium repens]|nr:hypothetical protein QL285_083855 [Trifolium repens]